MDQLQAQQRQDGMTSSLPAQHMGRIYLLTLSAVQPDRLRTSVPFIAVETPPKVGAGP